MSVIAIMRHEVESGSEAHRLLQNALSARRDALTLLVMIDQLQEEMATAGARSKPILERALCAERDAMLDKAMDAGGLEQQATTAPGYIGRRR